MAAKIHGQAKGDLWDLD